MQKALKNQFKLARIQLQNQTINFFITDILLDKSSIAQLLSILSIQSPIYEELEET